VISCCAQFHIFVAEWSRSKLLGRYSQVETRRHVGTPKGSREQSARYATWLNHVISITEKMRDRNELLNTMNEYKY